MEFAVAIAPLLHFLESKGVSPDGLSVIFNFSDWRAASSLEMALKQDFNDTTHFSAGNFDVKGLHILGIKIIIKSPANEANLV